MPRITPTRAATEAAGVVLSVAWAVVALAHALAGAKRDLLLDDGDSVLLPLIVRSAHQGLPIEWGMSPVLFVFPELPLYVVSAAVTTTVSAALLLNGVLNVVVLYLLLRFVAGRMVRASAPAPGARDVRADGARGALAPVAGALAGTAVFVALCLLETRPGGNTGEIASLYLTTTYYAGTVMAVVAATGLVVHIAGHGRRIPVAASVLALLSALATLSNPLYVLWLAAPAALALAVLAVVRLRWRGSAWALGALLVGSAVGYEARTPLSSYLIADSAEYFRWDPTLSLQFFSGVMRDLVTTPGGVVEVVVGLLLIGVSVLAVALRLRRRRDDGVAIGALIAVCSVVIVPVGLVVTGSISTRYGLPILFSPLIALVGVVSAALARQARAPARERLPGIRRIRGRSALIAVSAVVIVATVAAGVPGSAKVVGAARASGDPAARCLTDWARGKDVSGAAQFWLGRGLEAYGGPDVHLLQVTSSLTTYPWLVNLAAYRGARVGYVVVATGMTPGGHEEGFGDSMTQLGAPRDVVTCDGYDIVDYRGTSGEKKLTHLVVGSATVQAGLRGFGW